ALVRILKELEPALLGGGEHRGSGEVGVIFAGIGIEGLPVLLVSFESSRDRIKCAATVGQCVAPKNRGNCRSVTRIECVGSDLLGTVIRHFKGREQRNAGLRMARIYAAIPGETTGRAVVDAFVCFVFGIKVVLGELRYRLQIADGGYVAKLR